MAKEESAVGLSVDFTRLSQEGAASGAPTRKRLKSIALMRPAAPNRHSPPSAAPANYQSRPLDARTTRCTPARNSSWSKIPAAAAQNCTRPTESQDSRAAANSNAPARPRKYKGSEPQRGNANHSLSRRQYCAEIDSRAKTTSSPAT